MDLNSLSAKIIKAEMLGDNDRVMELKNQLEELKKKQTEEPGTIGNQNRHRNHGNHHDRDRNDNRRNQRHGDRRDGGHQMSKEEISKLNALNAKILKAEMMGDDDRLADLKSQLDELKNGKKGLNREGLESNKFDHGLDEPMNRKEPLAKSSKVIQLARKISDDRLSLNQMFVKAKQGDIDEEAKLYLASSSKLLNADDEYEETIRKKKRKKVEKEEYEVIKDDEEDDECQWCITKLKKHLIVCIKQTIYLCLPAQEPLVPNHCYIRSRSHVKSSVQADEVCHREILNMRSRLCDMLESDKRNCIFMEIFFRKSNHHHFQIECLPVKQKYFADAKMYFRKAILECETEWSDNKKLIEIKDKPITNAIPKGLSYFWVSFGPSNDGYGHVIEDERYFPRHFGHEVIAGLLDIDRYKYMKPRNETFDQQYDRVSKFKSSWKKFDTTEDEVIHEEAV